MNLKARPIANPVVVLREEFDDWAVLYNADTAYAAGTNPVGVAVWKLMNGRRTVEEIAVEIRSCFDDAPEASLLDVAAFIEAMAEQGLVGLALGHI